jgi:hypothetical protein
VNIHNFANRQLCEYASIFPTVAALLDHLLFTIGNGYDFDEDSGMIVDGDGQPIDEYPKMTPVNWKSLIAKCYAKERKWAEEYKLGGTIDEARLAENCARYRIINVDDSMFTEDSLYSELVKTQNLNKAERFSEQYHRPYPLSEKYSDVFNLNVNTPDWFVQIAVNLCNAWIRFLDEAIAKEDYWIQPSLRKNKPVAAPEFAELFDFIKADPAYDGWADRPEPESDYGDLSWTTRHRDMLVGQVQRLKGLLNA